MSQYRCNSEVQKPGLILVHEPGLETKLAVQHPNHWGFDPSLVEEKRPYHKWLEDAQAEHRAMVSAIRAEGIDTVYVTDLLRQKEDACRRYLKQEIDKAKAKPGLSTRARKAIREYADKAVETPVDATIRGLEIADSFREMPYAEKIAVYRKLRTLMPQTSLYYTQDGVISAPGGLIEAKMGMWDRVQEPKILRIALGDENYVYEVEHRAEGGDITMADKKSMHGGDILYKDGVMLVGVSRVGGLGIVKEAERLAKAANVEDLLFFYMPDIFDPQLAYATGNIMHFDTLANPVEPGVLLANKEMLKKTGVFLNNRLVDGYNWAKRNYDTLVEVPDEEQPLWAANVLPVGNRKVLSSPSFKRTNKNLRKKGLSVVEISSDTLTQGFGCFHCMTAYLK